MIWLLRLIRPITKLIAKVKIPWSVKKITGQDLYNLEGLLEPGDVILSKTNGHLSSLFVPGGYSHGAVYCGHNGLCPVVIEAIGEGIGHQDLCTHLLSKDKILIMRPKLTDAQRLEVFNDSYNYVGLDYDLEFESNDQEFYCFELVAQILKNVSLGEIMVEKKKVLGHDFYVAESFLEDSKNFSVVYYSDGD